MDRIADHIADFSLSYIHELSFHRHPLPQQAPTRSEHRTEAKQMTTSTPLTPPQPAEPTTRPRDSCPSARRSPTAQARRRKPVIIARHRPAWQSQPVVVWRVFFATPALPDSIVAVSGRIEGDDSAVASQDHRPHPRGPCPRGRHRQRRRHNRHPRRRADSRPRGPGPRRAGRSRRPRAQAAREQIAVLQQQLLQSQLQVGQSKFDTEGRVKQAEADLAAAQSDLAQQQAAYNIAAFNKDAYGRLAKSGAVSERQGLQAAATADQQAAAVAASQRRVEAAQAELTTAQGMLSNPSIHESQVALVRSQIAQQQAEVAGATAQTQQAQADLAEAEDNRQDLTIRAPFTGTVVTRAAEPGEMVTAGTAIITLLDLTKVYLRGFIPEGQIGEVKLGQPAHVFLDSNPKQPIDAYVSSIDPQATFTPENTYFRDDRVKQVVGVKLQLKSGFGFAKPGMPADGEILVQGRQVAEGRTHQ